MASKLKIIAEQTEFLQERQKETKTIFEKAYGDFLKFLDEKKTETQTTNEEEYNELVFIHETIKTLSENLIEQMVEDIDFLEKQVAAIHQVCAMNDPVKEAEVEKVLLEGEEEVLETEAFKKEVIAEAQASEQGITTLINDFKNTLLEGNAKTLSMLLETLMNDEKDDENLGHTAELEGFEKDNDFNDDDLPEKLGKKSSGCCKKEVEKTSHEEKKTEKKCCKDDTEDKCCSEGSVDTDIFEKLKEQVAQEDLENDDMCCGKGTCGNACSQGGTCACKE